MNENDVRIDQLQNKQMKFNGCFNEACIIPRKYILVIFDIGVDRKSSFNENYIR